MSTSRQLTKFQILQRYQHTPVGSKASKMPFLELVAVAIHSIAVQLFNADTGLHKDAVWPSDETYRKNNLGPRWPTPFSLFDYALWDQYPDGPADAAGYWAENRIFGGVVLFGRGDDGAGVCFHVASLAEKRFTLRYEKPLVNETKTHSLTL